MGYRKCVILIFTLLLSLLVLRNYTDSEWGSGMPLTAQVVSDGHTEQITCWKDQWNDYCFFLPAYADPAAVQIRKETGDEIWIGDHFLTGSGISCSEFQMAEVYGLARIGRTRSYDGVIRFIQSANVPTLFIDVASGSMDYIHLKKGNEETGDLRIYSTDGTLNTSVALESIKGRGNATWEMDKKAYSLTLAEQTDLLGMGQAQRWILLANVYDTSNLKNKIAYDLAAEAGLAYSPDSQWVDLYLNGEYAGLYLLCERNEIHPERVDINPDTSFLISREGQDRLFSQNYPYFNLQSGKGFRIHQSAFEVSRLEEMWRSLEDALFAEDGIDPVTGKHWTQIIDLDSWVKRYLLDEISANYDGGGISQFFYYDESDPSGRIYAGPVWDMDITFGADFWQVSPPNNFVARRPVHLNPGENSPFALLYQKEEFYSRVTQVYETTFRPLLEALLDSGLDQYARQIAQPTLINQFRWNMYNSAEETERIRAFLTQRMAFLDSVWLREEEYCDVLVLDEFYPDEFGVVAWFAVKPGAYLPALPERPNSAWYVYETREPYDIRQPVTESVNICLKTTAVPQETSAGIGTEAALFGGLVVILAAVFVTDRIRSRKNRPEEH